MVYNYKGVQVLIVNISGDKKVVQFTLGNTHIEYDVNSNDDNAILPRAYELIDNLKNRSLN